MANSNIWKEFQGLLPKVRQVIGTVVSHNSNGTSTITLRNGSSITAKGQGVSIGQKALIKDGEVLREVPNLTLYNSQV
ncbi:hypothetical protein [Sansalvadorimonas verongulae]|uniref:hypothetical protein n=1 Tax=Sansalvadorimonas verongulae TaxID=2172824 RepID=UPI0012BC9CF2|nr:hypothetical protein [Sansalvadorimonas verongulae]MTI11686.1 hypothetical protein [Sansalvadorimonas verongulae]